MNLKKSLVRSFALAALSFLALSPVSQAAGVYLGFLGGVTMINSDDAAALGISSNQFTLGGTAGLILPGGLGIGAHVSRIGYSISGTDPVTGNTFTSSNNQLNVFGELNYFVSVLHAGVKVGEALSANTVTESGITVPTVSSSTWAYGPTVGLDIPLGMLFKIGAEGTYLKYTAGGSNILALGVLKLSF